MPTVFTHALVGGALASWVPAGVSRTRLAVVAAALATLPDLDVIGLRLGVPYGHLLGHRGLSHSLVFAGVLAFLAARICFPQVAWRTSSGRRLIGLLFVASGSHGILDAFTNGGLGIGFFIPFSSERYFLPWHPIKVSSIGINFFLSARSLKVLMSEFFWVWLPLLLCLAGVKAKRRQARQSTE